MRAGGLLYIGGMEYKMSKKKTNQQVTKKNTQHNTVAKETKREEKCVEKENIEAVMEEEAASVEKEQQHVTASSDKQKTQDKTEKTSNTTLEKIVSMFKGVSLESIGTVGFAAVKVVLPVAALFIVIVIIVSLVQTRNEKKEEEVVAMTEPVTEVAVMVEPLEKDAYQVINDLMSAYYAALSAGNMEVVNSLMDDVSETDLVGLKNKNFFVKSYENISCYTRKGPEEDSFFVYVTYQAQFNDMKVRVPGVETHYVYKTGDNYKIAKEMSDEVNEARIESSSQDDVVDIFNKIDVEYKEILATNEELNNFLSDITIEAKNKTGEELAKLEAAQAEATEMAEAAAVAEVAQADTKDQPQTQIVDEEVKTTATVNVRSSDSENADKIGKVSVGTVLKRVENKINGWSKIIYEGKEAFIKSDYLEVVSSNQVEKTTIDEQEPARAETTISNPSTSPKESVTARTNVNVRNQPSTAADTIGKANGGNTYKVIEDQGEWLKIEYKGQTGYVKSEFFD